jgi:hypothetical protein
MRKRDSSLLRYGRNDGIGGGVREGKKVLDIFPYGNVM